MLMYNYNVNTDAAPIYNAHTGTQGTVAVFKQQSFEVYNIQYIVQILYILEEKSGSQRVKDDVC